MCDTSLGGFNLDPSALIAGSVLNKKHGPKPGPPRPRTLQEEIDQILGVMENIQPRVNALNNNYSTNGAQNLADQYANIIGPASRSQSALANTSQRQADLADVQNFGPASVQAILNADPQQRALRDSANQGVLAEYAKGGTYDPVDARKVVQQARGSRTSQGFGQGSNNDLLSEALALGIGGEGLRQQRFQNVEQVMQSNQQQAGDPFLAVLGRPAQSLGFAQNAYSQSKAGQPNTDPFQSQYGQDLFNTNFNAAYANLFSQRNQDAAHEAALYGLIGSVIGGGSHAAAAAI